GGSRRCRFRCVYHLFLRFVGGQIKENICSDDEQQYGSCCIVPVFTIGSLCERFFLNTVPNRIAIPRHLCEFRLANPVCYFSFCIRCHIEIPPQVSFVLKFVWP